METFKYFSKSVPRQSVEINNPRVAVVNDNMFILVKEVRKRYPESKILFHNFANDFNPCANSVTGHSQEVQLFKRTRISDSLTRDLYPICPGIILTKNVSYSRIKMDVASIAALESPLKREITRNKNFIRETFALESEYTEMRNRIELFLKLAQNYDFVITGAFGCGLFRNPIYGICELWNSLLIKYPVQNIIFCIYKEEEYRYFSEFIIEK